MRKPNRTPKRRLLFSILHTSRISPPPSNPTIYAKHNRLTKYITHSIFSPNTRTLLNSQTYMISMHNGIHSKNTIIWLTPLTTKSTCRGTNRRINSPSSYPTKTWRLWYDTNHNNSRTNYNIHVLSIHNAFPMRHSNNKCNLPTTNGLKITNCILIRKPHSSSNHGYSNPNALKLYRRNSPNNRPWSHIINTFLSSKH